MFGFVNASTVAAGPGLKNIKLLQPGYALSQAGDWSTPLLTLLSKFDVLRFMDCKYSRFHADRDTEFLRLPAAPGVAPSRARQRARARTSSCACAHVRDTLHRAFPHAVAQGRTRMALLKLSGPLARSPRRFLMRWRGFHGKR